MKISHSQKRIIRVIIAISILIIYFYTILPFYQNIDTISTKTSNEIAELTKPPQPYTYQIPLYFSFNGSSPFLNANETDFAFLLTITYPNGTLIPNEVVHINSTAVMGNIVKTLDHVSIIFPNTLSIPIVYGENRLPIQGIIFISQPD